MSDEDDSMAANPEEPRADLGYGVTAEPRSRRPRGAGAGRWEIVWRDGAEAPESTPPTDRRCRICREPTSVLVSVGDDIRRNACPSCQGKHNARIVFGDRGAQRGTY